ncbi:hypothetical protein [Bradyrhizobium sp. USDA 10063]
MPEASERTTREVFEDHLKLRAGAKLEEDLQHNYAPGIVLLCKFAVLRGHDAIRTSAKRLGLQLPNASFTFTTTKVADEYAFLAWRAESERYKVEDGFDSFVIRSGKIIMQTISYKLIRPSY